MHVFIFLSTFPNVLFSDNILSPCLCWGLVANWWWWGHLGLSLVCLTHLFPHLSSLKPYSRLHGGNALPYLLLGVLKCSSLLALLSCLLSVFLPFCVLLPALTLLAPLFTIPVTVAEIKVCSF